MKLTRKIVSLLERLALYRLLQQLSCQYLTRSRHYLAVQIIASTIAGQYVLMYQNHPPMLKYLIGFYARPKEIQMLSSSTHLKPEILKNIWNGNPFTLLKGIWWSVKHSYKGVLVSQSLTEIRRWKKSKQDYKKTAYELMRSMASIMVMTIGGRVGAWMLIPLANRVRLRKEAYAILAGLLAGGTYLVERHPKRNLLPITMVISLIQIVKSHDVKNIIR